VRTSTLLVAVWLLGQATATVSAGPQAAPSASTAATPTTTVSIADLGFMTGSWRLTRGDSVVEEHWTGPRGGTLFGIGRTMRGDETSAFEFLRIEARRDGIYYVASPSGRPATPFKLRQFAKDRVVFENRAHDFPQRIAYWREGDRLCAEVSGTAKGKPSTERWCWDPAAL
jgi:hypothetical protein